MKDFLEVAPAGGKPPFANSLIFMPSIKELECQNLYWDSFFSFKFSRGS